MDKRTGQTYKSAEEAMAAGVPPEQLVQMRTILHGPFKGRVYEVSKNGGLGRRRLDLERRRPA